MRNNTTQKAKGRIAPTSTHVASHGSEEGQYRFRATSAVKASKQTECRDTRRHGTYNVLHGCRATQGKASAKLEHKNHHVPHIPRCHAATTHARSTLPNPKRRPVRTPKTVFLFLSWQVLSPDRAVPPSSRLSRSCLSSKTVHKSRPAQQVTILASLSFDDLMILSLTGSVRV